MPTRWLEVSVRASNEAAEAVAEVLTRFALNGVCLETADDDISANPVTVRGYVPADRELARRRRQVEEALWHLSQILPIPEPTFRTVREADWAEEWKKHLKVLRIGQRIVIRPSWLPHRAAPGDVVIELDPGMAFGTGLHPTTQMCLLALEEHIQPRTRVLDLGTGSGILAIAAAKLGAASVLALDTDSQAVAVARQNVRRNGVARRTHVSPGSLAQAEGTFDLVLVNILARVIVDMARQDLADRLADGGLLVAAGLTEEQEPEVAAALHQARLCIVARRQMEDWVALEASRAPQPAPGT